MSNSNTSQPFFSVIIPVYNSVNLISDTLKSALSQIFTDYEIIIVNDGSTDGTKDVLETFAMQSALSIRVFHQENKGQGEARNLGIQQANGRYVAFLDSDDIWFPWTLQTYFNVLKQYEFPSVLIGTGKEFSDPSAVSLMSQGSMLTQYFEDYFSLAYYPYIAAGTPGTLVRVDQARRVGGFSTERFSGEDQEFLFKLGDAKGLIHVRSPLTVAIRRHEGNFQKNIDMIAKGAIHLISSEFNNQYPGGIERQWARRQILTRMLRTMSVQCINAKKFSQAREIYWRTLGWHLRQMRFRYIIGFPILYLLRLIV
jgi:glycosyltransferase involved in cell wall biosynthesis